MKTKIIIALLLGLFSISGMAQGQNSSTHLPFMGIPIDGDFSSFVQKLQSKGFQLQEDNGTYVIMTGIFSGNNVELRVFGTPRTKIACGVSVVFPTSDNYQFMYNKFTSFKKSLTSKYGEGVSEEDHTGWTLDKGIISLKLEYNSQYNLYRIRLLYSDAANYEKMVEETDSDF